MKPLMQRTTDEFIPVLRLHSSKNKSEEECEAEEIFLGNTIGKQNINERPCEKINLEAASHVAKLHKKWKFEEEAQSLYHHHTIFNQILFKSKLTKPIIAIQDLSSKQNGLYITGRNSIGALNHITINSRLFKNDFFREARCNEDKIEKEVILATLLHEMIHQYQFEVGKKNPMDKNDKKKNYHDSEFQKMTKEFGIRCDQEGRLKEIYVNSPFTATIDSYGSLPNPVGIIFTEEILIKKEVKMKKYTCNCIDKKTKKRLAIRVAYAGFNSTCNNCKQPFRME